MHAFATNPPVGSTFEVLACLIVAVVLVAILLFIIIDRSL